MTYRFLAAAAAMLFLGAMPARADGFVLTYHQTEKDQGGAAAASTSEADYTVTLYPQMVDVKTGDTEDIYDFAAGTYLTANLSRHIIASYALAAIPLQRHWLKDARQSAPAGATPVDIDMLYGSDGDTKTSALVQTAFAGTQASFSANGAALASFSPSETAVPEAMKASYAHFILYRLNLHPVIRAALNQTGKVFRTLSFTNLEDGRTKNFSLTLGSAQSAPGNGPQLGGLEPVFTGDESVDGPIRGAIAITGKTKPELETAVAALLQKGDDLHAALAAKEAELMLGPDALRDSAAYQQAMKSTAPAVAALLAATDTAPASTAAFIKNMQALNTLKPQAGDKAYVLELLRAKQIFAVVGPRRQRSPDEERAMDAVLQKSFEAIHYNPWLTGAYCLVGEAELARGNFPQALAFWDLAARLASHYPGVQQGDALRESARHDFPEYF